MGARHIGPGTPVASAVLFVVSASAGQGLLWHLAWTMAQAGLQGTLCLYMPLPPSSTVRTKCSSQVCSFHHPCQVPSKTPPLHPPMYKQSVPSKPAHCTTHARCHRRTCPGTQHHTTKVFLASLIAPPCMPKAIEDPALPPLLSYEQSVPRKPAHSTILAKCHRRPHPATHHQRASKLFLASLLTPPPRPHAIEGPALPPTTIQTKCSSQA